MPEWVAINPPGVQWDVRWRQMPTFQAAHSPPSRRFLGDGPYQSGTRIAGFWQTGLLAANGSGTFPAFIFKNALAAYNGIADYRLPIGFFAVFSRDPGWG